MKIHKKMSLIFSVVMIISLVLAGSAAAKSADKVEICHRKGNGSFVLLKINPDALQDHLSHGDAAPGAAVPGQPGKVLAADCSVNSTGQNEPVQTVPIPSTSNHGKKTDKVDVCHKRGNGTFILINISRNALPAHLTHGDGLPDGWVPDQPGKKLTTTCSIVDVPQKELVETLTVYPNGDLFSSMTLQNGQLYEIRASGTYTYDEIHNWADAEYSLLGGVPIKGDSHYSNYPYILDLSINGYSTNTDWGAFQPLHVYTKQWMGNGEPLSFSIFDIDYHDNEGFLTVEIWKINW
jgi:hypothetical protein